MGETSRGDAATWELGEDLYADLGMLGYDDDDDDNEGGECVGMGLGGGMEMRTIKPSQDTSCKFKGEGERSAGNFDLPGQYILRMPETIAEMELVVELDQLRRERGELQERTVSAEGQAATLAREMDGLVSENATLRRNMSKLFLSAKAEIERKTKRIRELEDPR